MPRSNLPPPLDEVAAARVHLVVAMAFFGWGVVEILLAAHLLLGILQAFPLIVLGAFTTLIIGTSRMLAASLFGIRLRGGRAFQWIPGLLVVFGAIASRFSLTTTDSVFGWGAALWSVGVVLHVGGFALSAAPRARRPKPLLPMAGRRVGGAVVPLVLAGGYAIASLLVVPLGYSGRLALPIVVHTVLTGFVVVTIVAMASLLLQRFTQAPLPGALVVAYGVLAGVGPGLLALDIMNRGIVFRVGAVVEAAGLFLFGGTVMIMVLQAKKVRATMLAYAAGALSMWVGVGLGLAFAFIPSSIEWTAFHGAINLLGSAGLFVVAAAWDLYLPGLRKGVLWLRGQMWFTVSAAVVGLVWFALAYPNSPGLARWGFGVYALAPLSLLLGALFTVMRVRWARRGAMRTANSA